MTAAASTLPAPVMPDRASLEAAVDRGIRQYVTERRDRIDPFVRRHFGVDGAFRLHRHALGLDLLRAPANLLMAVPHVGMRLAATGLRRARITRPADWLDRQQPFLTSDVAREVEWRVFTELLELPYAQPARTGYPARSSDRDALADAVMAQPEIQRAMVAWLVPIGRRADDPKLKAWLTEAMATYAGARVSASDLANAVMIAATGALTFKELTPGALSLGPLVAQAMANQMAVAAFPLGAGVGGLWYGAMPVAASTGLVVGVTGGLMAVASMLAAFSGIVTDPVQAKLGWHQRRLHKLVDGVDRALGGDGEGQYALRDHYVARVFDVLDVLAAAYRASAAGP